MEQAVEETTGSSSGVVGEIVRVPMGDAQPVQWHLTSKVDILKSTLFDELRQLHHSAIEGAIDGPFLVDVAGKISDLSNILPAKMQEITNWIVEFDRLAKFVEEHKK